MPEGFSLRQLMLPFGFLMALGTLLALHLKRRLRRRMSSELPELASRLGLTHRPATSDGGLGTLAGEFQGFEVWVDPDETSKLKVHFDTHPTVELRDYVHFKRAPAGMEKFDTESDRFNTFFKDRYASPHIADFLFDRPELDTWVADMQRSGAKLKALAVTPEGIDCALDLKHPAVIPPKTVEKLLGALTQLAQLVESARQEAHD